MSVVSTDTNTFNTLFGKVKIPEVEVEIKTPRLNLFDFVQDINHGKRYLYGPDNASSYEPFLVNKAMAIFTDTFECAAFLNASHHLDKDMQHDYLFHSVLKRRRWKKDGWLKRTEQEKLEFKTLRDVAKTTGLNIKNTKWFWNTLSQAQRQEFLDRYVYPDERNS
jgi:hypothetical protein